jgi:AbrB family looped-hinge helix DNA binding protein
MEIDVVTVSSRGQIVIPGSIRKDLRIKEGEKLLAYEKGDTIVLKKLDVLKKGQEESQIEKIFTLLQEKAKEAGITRKDVMEEIQRYRTEKRKK